MMKGELGEAGSDYEIGTIGSSLASIEPSVSTNRRSTSVTRSSHSAPYAFQSNSLTLAFGLLPIVAWKQRQECLVKESKVGCQKSLRVDQKSTQQPRKTVSPAICGMSGITALRAVTHLLLSRSPGFKQPVWLKTRDKSTWPKFFPVDAKPGVVQLHGEGRKNPVVDAKEGTGSGPLKTVLQFVGGPNASFLLRESGKSQASSTHIQSVALSSGDLLFCVRTCVSTSRQFRDRGRHTMMELMLLLGCTLSWEACSHIHRLAFWQLLHISKILLVRLICRILSLDTQTENLI
jgi:hypothetical protein